MSVARIQGAEPHSHCASPGVISNWKDEPRLPPCTIFQAFKYYLDITTPPTPLQLQQFASLATSEKEKQRLLVLSKVGPGFCKAMHMCSSNCSRQMAVSSEGGVPSFAYRRHIGLSHLTLPASKA